MVSAENGGYKGLSHYKDPIQQLEWDLFDYGKPSLAWMVRWGQNGDPVAAAWKQSNRPASMRTILYWVYPISPLEVKGSINNDSRIFCRLCIRRLRDPCKGCVDLIRKNFPVPPTVTQLMNAMNS